VSVPQPSEVIRVLPERLVSSEEYCVRFGSGDEAEIDQLALSMERDGQQDDIIVIPNHDPHMFVIIAGNRRKRAAAKINEKRTLAGGELFRLRARVERGNGVDRFRQAAISNIHRENYGPMELAKLIELIKTRNKWEGYKGSVKVANYLAVNPATVTQHEKFLAAPKEIRDKLTSRELTAQSAFAMLDVKPEKRDEVLAKARENQAEANAAKSRPVKPPLANRVEHPAVVKAIRSVEGSSNHPPVRGRKEILEMIEQLDGPAYGYPDSAVRMWARYVVDKWAPGGGSDRTWGEKFDAMVARAPRGTLASESKKPRST